MARLQHAQIQRVFDDDPQLVNVGVVITEIASHTVRGLKYLKLQVLCRAAEV